jgi:hypothetical protein
LQERVNEISAKKKTSIKPFIIDFWQRDVGATWLSFERKKINEFSKVKPNEKTSLSGYVKWVNDLTFALIPTLFSNQIHLICSNDTDKKPLENSHITIFGNSKFDRLRPRPESPESTRFEGNLIIYVHDWTYTKSEIESPKSYLDYKAFKKNLTSRVEGLEPQIRDFLAFTAISTPTFYQNAGGVNLTMYDSTKSGLPKLVAQELKKAIPEGIGSTNTIETNYGNFKVGYQYAFLTEDADKPLSPKTEELLAHQISRFMPACTETSISMFSSKDRPATIEDAPCRLSDIPTVIPEETSILRSIPSIDPFDAFNFIVMNHYKAPVISDLSTSLTEVADNIEKLADDYALDPRQLTQYGFLNANYNARPTSVLRNSLSFARAQNVDIVTPEFTKKVFDDFFKWNFEYIYEVWEDLLAKPLVGKKTVASLRVKYRDIIRIIRKYNSSHLPGVNREDIIREAKTNPLETQQLLDECNTAGIVFQPVQGFYRLTRDDA